jgi:hypothetical protein
MEDTETVHTNKQNEVSDVSNHTASCTVASLQVSDSDFKCLMSVAQSTNLQFYSESWWVRLLLF